MANAPPFSESVPAIETERLLLRGHRVGDFADCLALWTDPEVTRFIGEVGFADFRRDIEPSLEGVPEIGWVIAPHAHGRGYATEAARAAVAWGRAHFGPVRTACIIAPENEPSIRVAQRCGYREFRHTAYKGQPTIMLVREDA